MLYGARITLNFINLCCELPDKILCTVNPLAEATPAAQDER